MGIYWPIMLAVAADIFYQVTAKSTPHNLNPFAALTITYLVSSAVCFLLFYVTKGGSLLQEYTKVNWTTFVMSLAIVGLEAGSIYMYKVGWNINTGFIVKAICVGIALIIVGYLIYNETVSFTKIAGIAVCLVGLYLINK